MLVIIMFFFMLSFFVGFLFCPLHAAFYFWRSTISTAIGTFDSTSSSFGNAATNSNSSRDFLSANGNGVALDETTKRKVIAEEEAAMEMFRVSFQGFYLQVNSEFAKLKKNRQMFAMMIQSVLIRFRQLVAIRCC